MKNLVNNIFTAICLVSLTANLNACGRAEMSVMPETVPAIQYTASTIEQAPENNQLLIKFQTNITKSSIDSFNAKYGTRTLKIIPGINVYVVDVPLETRASELVKYLGNDPMVKYVEVNTTIQLNPDVEVNPVYTINGTLNYGQMIGKQMDVKGIYKTSRSGAIISTKDADLSIVDLDGTVITKFPNMPEGSSVSISGIIKGVKGFNLTKNLGIMPVSFVRNK